LKKKDVKIETNLELPKKTESKEEVINLTNSEEALQNVVEEEIKENSSPPSDINWFEKLNFSGADEAVDVTDLKPLYQVRKDISNKKNVLVSVRYSYKSLILIIACEFL